MKKIVLVVIVTLLLLLALFAADDTKLLRTPDIEIWDLPELVARGGDPSLERAIAFLLEELKKNPPKKVAKPGDPDRSKWHEKKK